MSKNMINEEKTSCDESRPNASAAVIGAGAAGISAALCLAKNGINVVLVSAQPSARAQSVMAEGGINGALGADDSCELHAEETLRAGRFLADPDAVRGLTDAAPGIIKWLDDMGMSFKHDDEGRPALRAFGGQSRKRTAFADASTGRQLMSTLIMMLRRYEADGSVVSLTFKLSASSCNMSSEIQLKHPHTTYQKVECSIELGF